MCTHREQCSNEVGRDWILCPQLGVLLHLRRVQLRGPQHVDGAFNAGDGGGRSALCRRR